MKQWLFFLFYVRLFSTSETGNKKKKGTISLKKRTPKQIAALICVALIILAYAAAFVVSLMDSKKSGELFQACLLATVFLPILCWIYIWLYGQVKQKHTIADLDILQTGENEASNSKQN